MTLRTLILCAIFVACCSCIDRLGSGEPSNQGEQYLETAPEPPAFNRAFRIALERLKEGEIDTAREILEESRGEEEGAIGATEADFYLGLIMLMDIDDFASMTVCRDHFKAYCEAHPHGPYTRNAERILALLQKQMASVGRDWERIGNLKRQVKECQEEIETLKYQIQRLEEIQRETESRRQLLE